MALSVVKQPISLKIVPSTISTPLSCNVSDVSGEANFNVTGHGLITGDYVYVVSDCSEYNGFWYVSRIDNDNFRIREYATASNVLIYPYKTTNRSATVYTVDLFSAGWNAVHNPIVYKLKSDLWPTNSVDTARTVSSYANDLGYVKLTLSGSLGTITELEFVKVTFTGGESSIYQILTWYSATEITISLPYIGGITFISVQKYYRDYHARIKIYAGLVSTHFYADQKPYVELAEIKAVPDETGIMTVNINEILKSRIEILKNNLNLGATPNSIDSFCQFYISYAEAYTYSVGGYTLLDYVGSYTDDTGDFYAVNASLPFKNPYSGMMSEYMGIIPSYILTKKFLTSFRTPVLSAIQSRTLGPVSQFFDISFIRVSSNDTRIRREVYQNGVIVNTFIDSIPNVGFGIYRYQVERSVYLEDRIDIVVQVDSGGTWFSISEVKTIEVDASCGPTDNFIDISWINNLGGFDYWRFKALSDYGIDIEETKESSKNIFPEWPRSWGEDADTVDFETSRKSRQTITVRAENLSKEQAEDLALLKTSPLVQIVNSRADRRTVLVDKSSFVYLKEGERLFSLTFDLKFTNLLPSQSL